MKLKRVGASDPFLSARPGANGGIASRGLAPRAKLRCLLASGPNEPWHRGPIPGPIVRWTINPFKGHVGLEVPNGDGRNSGKLLVHAAYALGANLTFSVTSKLSFFSHDPR